MPLTWEREGKYWITSGKWTISIASVSDEWRYTLWRGGVVGKPGGKMIESSTDLEFLKSFADSMAEAEPSPAVEKPMTMAQRDLLEEVEE